MEQLHPHTIPERLLMWYQNCKRDLPWRRTRDPYCIWVSEIMLQQTRVEAAIGYYTRFIKELPHVPALAAASDDRLLKLWEGLGYYSRVKNLRRAAVQMVAEHGGKLPPSHKALLALPGIGPYTAGAVASIAFGVPVPAIDGNVLRVLTRLTANGEDITKKHTVATIEQQLFSILPSDCPGEFNQALMELGAVVCLPNTTPKCEVCPLQGVCKANAEGNPKSYPVKPPKAPRKILEKSVFIVEYDGHLLLHKRPATGLLAGMWEFPNLPERVEDEAVPQIFGNTYGFHINPVVRRQFYKHVFTHQEWHMWGFFVQAAQMHPCGKAYHWAPLGEIMEDLSVPSAFRAFLETASRQGG